MEVGDCLVLCGEGGGEKLAEECKDLVAKDDTRMRLHIRVRDAQPILHEELMAAVVQRPSARVRNRHLKENGVRIALNKPLAKVRNDSVLAFKIGNRRLQLCRRLCAIKLRICICRKVWTQEAEAVSAKLLRK